MTRDEHLRRMYATGTTAIGNKAVMQIACSACSNADLRADGIDLLSVLRAADHHITATGLSAVGIVNASDGSNDCAFCDIIQGKAPATVVCEWDDAMAIVPLGPVVEGHTLVIPKRHVADAASSPDTSAATMRRAAEIVPWPANIITSIGADATQSVFHLHLHIVPRAENDGLALPWYSGKRSKQTRRITASSDHPGEPCNYACDERNGGIR